MGTNNTNRNDGDDDEEEEDYDRKTMKERDDDDEDDDHRKALPVPRYQKPSWSGKPSHEIKVEILKHGCLIETLNITEKGKAFVSFGRHPTCDITCEHQSISRLHLIVQFKANTDEMYAYDPGSTHGVYVNKKRLKREVYAPIFVGDQIRLGASQRDYVLIGSEALMQEETLTNRMLLKRAEEEKAIMEEKKMLDEIEKREKRKRDDEDVINNNAWGMGDDFDEAKRRYGDADDDGINWRTADEQKFSHNMRKAIEKVRLKEQKANNYRIEIERIQRKESAQENGLSIGQTQQIHKNETALELLNEQIEDADERLNESLREILGVQTKKAKKGNKKRSAYDDDDDDDDDGFYDRTEKQSSAKKINSNNKKQKKKKEIIITETAASLWDKKLTTESDIESLEIAYDDAKKDEQNARIERERLDALEDADAMDIFTSDARKEAIVDTLERLEKSINEKRVELERHTSLLKLADPTEEFKPGTSQGDALKESIDKNTREKEEVETRRKQELLEKAKEEKLKEKEAIEERARMQKWEKEGQLLEKKTFSGVASNNNNNNSNNNTTSEAATAVANKVTTKNTKIVKEVEDEAPVIVEEEEELKEKNKVAIPEEIYNRAAAQALEKVVKVVVEARAVKAKRIDDMEDDGFLTPTQVKALADKQGGFGLQIQKKKPPSSIASITAALPRANYAHPKSDEEIRSEAERKVELEMRKVLGGGFNDDDEGFKRDDDDDDNNWVAPAEQRGDGKTKLNEKLGY